jgi:endonuclease/exonuclease/phosphatase family metal-dependent hydrolase
MINAFFSKFQVPILFAADTNMTTDMKEYQVLVEDLFINTFNLKESFKVKGAYQDDKDLCYLRKGKVFPACRVDHILISQPKRWKVKEFSIDTNKYGKTFPSDHRPVILSIELN